MKNKEKDFEKGWEEYQAEKKQAIEEIHNFILETYDYNSWDKARAFYSAGYGKVNKDSVVLSKAKYEMLVACSSYEGVMGKLKDEYIRGSKEAAEKYHNAIKNLFDKRECCGCIEDSPVEQWHADNNEIAKQLGIEIKE